MSRSARSGNWVVEESLAEIRTRIHEGVPISQPLQEDAVFRRWSRMVKIGEDCASSGDSCGSPTGGAGGGAEAS